MIIKDEMTFKELSATWIREVKQIRKPSTHEKYNNILQGYFLPLLGDKNCYELGNVTLEEIIKCKWNDSLSNPSESTVNGIRSVFVQLANRAGIKPLADKMDYSCEMVSTEKSYQNSVEVFSSTQQRRLMRCLLNNPDRFKLGIIICLYTGIRVGELCALKTTDMSLCEKKIFINSTVQRLRNENKADTNKTKLVVTTPKPPVPCVKSLFVDFYARYLKIRHLKMNTFFAEVTLPTRDGSSTVLENTRRKQK